MTKSLTKAALLGTQHREPVPLVHPQTGESYLVEVRPLSDGEAGQIRATQLIGLQMAGGSEQKPGADPVLKADMATVVNNQMAARRLAVSMALLGEERWTPDEIAKVWPSVWVEQVSSVIFRLSGIQISSMEVRSFRSESGGAALGAADADGNSTGPDHT